MHFLDGEPVSDTRLAALALPNYGCLTTMAVADGRVRGLAMHLDRLRHDTAVLFGDAALAVAGNAAGASEVRRLVREAVAAGGWRHTVVRVTVFAAEFDIARPERLCQLSVLVSLRPLSPPPSLSPSLPEPPPSSASPPTRSSRGTRAKPLHVRSAVFTRSLPQVKHVGLVGQLHQRREARLAGYDDALFIDGHGRVTEGTTWNVGFADDDGRLVWPSSTEILPGVTMRLVRSAAERAGTPSLDKPLTPRSAAALTAAFATNAVAGVRTIGRIDDHEFPDEAGVVAWLAELYLADPGEPL